MRGMNPGFESILAALPLKARFDLACWRRRCSLAAVERFKLA
ncbi:MAG TPA: hypothetical protein VIQ62_01885 [Burkholderiales bacterium]